MVSVQWSELGVQGLPRGANGLNKPGPRLYEPEGKRFSLLQGDSNTSRVFQYVEFRYLAIQHPGIGNPKRPPAVAFVCVLRCYYCV